MLVADISFLRNLFTNNAFKDAKKPIQPKLSLAQKGVTQTAWLLVGEMIEKNITRKVIFMNMKYKWLADSTKSIQKLGIEYRSLEISINNMF